MKKGNRRGCLFAALAIVLLTVGTRLPALVHPEPIDDEAVYSIVANEILDGGRPYVDAVERKPPLLFWTYAGIFDVAGEYNWKALHLAALLWTLGAMAGLCVLATQLFDLETGLVAAAFYSIFQCWGTWKNLAFNGEMLMNLPLAWAWAIALHKGQSRARPGILAAGALSCAAFLLKQPAAIAAVPLGIYLLLPGYRATRGLGVRYSALHFTELVIGFFGTLALATLVLWHQGILADAYYWTIADHTVPHVFWTRGVVNTLAFVGACLPIVLGSAMAVRDREGLWAGRTAERIALFALVAASAIGAAAGGRFYPHYYIQLVPPLALLAAPFYAGVLHLRAPLRKWWMRSDAVFVWLGATALAFLISHWILLSQESEPSPAGQFLFKNSRPGDRVFVWGQRPEIYLESRLRPACRYILTFPLTGYIFGGPLPGVETRDRIMPGAWATLEEDFHKHTPTFIVEVWSGSAQKYPVKDFPILAALLTNDYRPVARTTEGVVYQRR